MKRGWFGGRCPICDSALQWPGAIKCLSRRYEITCINCGQRVESELTIIEYILLLLYTQILVFTLGVVFIFSLIGELWNYSLISLTLFSILLYFPASLVHARRLRAL